MSYYDPPDDEHPVYEELEAILPESLSESEADAIRELFAGLRRQLDVECSVCAARICATEIEAEKFAAQMLAEPLPTSENCLHDISLIDCSACAVAGDLAFDASRERRLFG